jgi:transglutaminase-like putative cysteine protease
VFVLRLLACLPLIASLALAADSPKLPEDVYELALLDGARVGFCHTAVTKDDGEDKQWRVTSSLELSLRRFSSQVRLRMDQGTVETPEGKVLGVFMKQNPGSGKQLLLSGVVIEDKLHVKIEGRGERWVAWGSDVLGVRAQEALFASKKPRAGNKLTFRRYEGVYNSVLTVRAVVKPAEEVDVLGKKQKLLRVEMQPDELKGSNVTIKPPRTVWWLDDTFAVVRRQTELDGLGTIILVRTTKERALAPSTAPAADVGKRSLVPLNRAIARPYDTSKLTYRITVKDEDDPAGLFIQDAHQEARNAKGNTFDLVVHPVGPGESGKEKAPAEYLGTSHYLDHGDARIKEMARFAVGTEKDAWKKAQRIERYVKNHLSNDNTADLVPASQIAKTRRGDCRHHAFLTAALCRAAGLPARMAIGLLYVNRGGPHLGFHTWVEVLVEGRWLGIDSTLGKGGVSAAHVKITQHSWHEVQSLTPLLPVSRVTGKLKVEVVKTE